MFSIDLESASGTKFGAGPISSASRWQHTRRMDRAGTVRFTMPATDERASLLSNRRYMRCRSRGQEFGHGIIDTIGINTEQYELTISGDDLLRELAMRPIGFIPFSYDTDPMPLTDALDLILTVCNDQADPDWTIDYTTYRSTGTITDGSDIITNVTNIQNWTGREGSPIFGEGIAAGTTVIAVGSDTLTLSAAATTASSTSYVTAVGAAVLIYSHTGSLSEPDVVLSRYQVYYKAGDESILSILSKMADLTGTHFRLGEGREIVWLYNVTPASGVRAVKDVDPIAAEDNTDICLITDLEYLQDSTALISHITPWGSGSGDTRLRMADNAADPTKTSRTAPTGYTLDLDNNVIRRDDAQTDYGYFNKYVSFNDINVDLEPGDTGYDAALVTARNQLFDAAIEYLRSHSYVQESFRLSVVKLDAEILPGQTIYVEYRGVGTVLNPYTGESTGGRWINIHEDLIVLEVTTEFDENGVRTPGLVVATIDRWPSNDVELLIKMLGDQQQGRGHKQ